MRDQYWLMEGRGQPKHYILVGKLKKFDSDRHKGGIFELRSRLEYI